MNDAGSIRGSEVGSTLSVGSLLEDGPRGARVLLVLAHGAGQGPDSPFMDRIATGVAGAGVRVVRFAFPYMVRARAEGRRRPPDREPILVEAWRQVIADQRLAGQTLLIGGKSMGARIASRVADESGAAGLICLGFPFHPPGRPERMRAESLVDLHTPTLICQGERDPFGSRGEVQMLPLSPVVSLCWIPGADHSFKPNRASGRSWEDTMETAVAAVIAFIGTLELDPAPRDSI